jgi:hypothetical protein
MPRLSELLSEEDRKKSEAWVDKALNPKYETDIPPELYQMALHGFYFGFGAIEAIFRGYIDSVDQRTGKPIRIPYDLETVIALNQAGRKVAYRQMVDAGDLQAMANVSSNDKNWAESALKRTNDMRKGKF